MRKNALWIFLSFISCLLCAQPAYVKNAVSKELAISQMNYCINSITNVIHYKSMPLLEHEIDQLLNNLTMEQIVGLYEVQSFRSTMIEKISALQITEEEKEVMKRVQEMKRENLLYQSISNSLNPTLLLTGGGNNAKQLTFMAIVSVARTVVEYKSASNEANIEELQAMWKYRKADLENFAELRQKALDLVYDLFQKYGLNESDRLTEATSTLFSQIIAEEDPHARIRKLLDNRHTFQGTADYYYYLGMAYTDIDNYSTGKKYLDQYLAMYAKAPIFRYDEKTGCIALSRLALENELSRSEVINLVNTAINNLPNNGPALIQAVLALNNIGEDERAFNLLRSGIDNNQVSDKDALVMLATKLLPSMKKYPLILSQMTAAINHCTRLSINSYIPSIVNAYTTNYWTELENVIKINGSEIEISSRYTADISSLAVQKEIHKKAHLDIYPCKTTFSNAVSTKKINKKFKFLKSNPEQRFIFFDAIPGNGDMYRVKANLDCQKVTDGDYPGMSSPYIVEKDRKKLAKYCRKQNEKADGCLRIVFKSDKSGKKKSLTSVYADYLATTEAEDALDYSAYNQNYMSGKVWKCKIITRDNVFKICPPLKNSPKEIIRIILPGVDTIQLRFTGGKNPSLYSVTLNNQECFRVPYNALSERSQIDKDAHSKEGWFKRLFHKKPKTEEGETVSADGIDDNGVDEKPSDNTKESWWSTFKKDHSYNLVSMYFHKNKDGLSEEQAAVVEKSSSQTEKESGKNWIQKIWDTVRFWKK